MQPFMDCNNPDWFQEANGMTKKSDNKRNGTSTQKEKISPKKARRVANGCRDG
jgi:hypothetical protein